MNERLCLAQVTFAQRQKWVRLRVAHDCGCCCRAHYPGLSTIYGS